MDTMEPNDESGAVPEGFEGLDRLRRQVLDDSLTIARRENQLRDLLAGTEQVKAALIKRRRRARSA